MTAKLVVTLLAIFTIAACGSGTARSASSPSASAPARSPTSSTTPSPQRLNALLHCEGKPSSARALALVHSYLQEEPVVILDVSNPLKPVVACTLSQAQGGRFLSATKIAFWSGDKLGIADVSAGTVVQTAQLPLAPASGAFSADGSEFAYRVRDGADAVSAHLYIAGNDRTLYTQEPMGGHGGQRLELGPLDILKFSPDGTELLDYMLFRPTSGPTNLLVFRVDGSTIFQQGGSSGVWVANGGVWAATGGVWAATGSVLYFPILDEARQVITVYSLDASGQRRTVATGVKGFYWPHLAPDGQGIVYHAPDSSVPSCGGLPHVWRLDLNTGSASQVSKSVSAIPVFVSSTIMWSSEEKQTDCGLDGQPSDADGVILAHDFGTGRDAPVDITFFSALKSSSPDQMSTYYVLDARF